MPKSKFYSFVLVYIFFLIPVSVFSQGKSPQAVTVIKGDTLFKLLDPNVIPAITKPLYVTGTVAATQMSPDEPVMGLLINGEAHAYSLWQLDHHEIVNDYFGDIPVAVTW